MSRQSKPDPFATLTNEPLDDDAYVRAQWAGTTFLMDTARDYEVMARDRSLEDEVRMRAVLHARAIREELRPA